MRYDCGMEKSWKIVGLLFKKRHEKYLFLTCIHFCSNIIPKISICYYIIVKSQFSDIPKEKIWYNIKTRKIQYSFMPESLANFP